IEDLPDYVDELDGEIMGIEPGAGLSMITEDDVMPHYGLDDDFELKLSPPVRWSRIWKPPWITRTKPWGPSGRRARPRRTSTSANLKIPIIFMAIQKPSTRWDATGFLMTIPRSPT